MISYRKALAIVEQLVGDQQDAAALLRPALSARQRQILEARER
jgi:hypothetical protein